MFKSLYRLHQHLDRRQPEAVLTGRGVLVMLIIFLTEQIMPNPLSNTLWNMKRSSRSLYTKLRMHQYNLSLTLHSFKTIIAKLDGV